MNKKKKIIITGKKLNFHNSQEQKKKIKAKAMTKQAINNTIKNYFLKINTQCCNQVFEKKPNNAACFIENIEKI